MSDGLMVVGQVSACTIAWFAAHHLLYVVVPKPPSVKVEKDAQIASIKFAHYISCFPAIIHSVLTVIFSADTILVKKPDFGGPADGLAKALLYLAISFYIHDGLLGYFRKYNPSWILAHHVGAVICLVWALAHGGYGTDVAFGLGLAELNEPLYNIHEILNYLQVPVAYSAPIGVSFRVTFCVIRGFLMPYALYFIQLGKADIYFKLFWTCMWLFSAMLIWVSINKCAKLLNSAYPSSITASKLYHKAKKLRTYFPIHMVGSVFVAAIGLIKCYYFSWPMVVTASGN